jgi:cell filamentation protein
MYEAADDPYCYPGTSVLRNRLGLREQAELDDFEAAITAQRADEPLPLDRLDLAAYRAIHRHLFQDIFDWAGEFRTIRIAKQGSMFCYPENIEREMRRLLDTLEERHELRGLTLGAFAESAAHVLAELDAIHPFREGNGRTQNVFLAILGERAGYPLDLSRLDPQAMLGAMIASFAGDETPLSELIGQLILSDDRA